MKKTLLLSSIVVIGTLVGSGVWATEITTTGGKDSGGGAFTEQPSVNVTGLAIADTSGLQDALDSKLNLSDVSTAVNTVLAGHLVTVDSEHPLPDADGIEVWAGNNADKIATVGQTFAVFKTKLDDVNTDINTALGTKANVSDITTSAGNYVNAGTNVGGNLTLLDTAVKGNENAIDLINTAINVSTSGNYIMAGTGVGSNLGALDSAVKGNADAISNVNTAITVATNGNYIVAGTGVASNLGVLDGAVKANENTIATKSGLTDNNLFTGLNTFKNANGVNITDDGTNTANLKIETVGSNAVLDVSGVNGVQASNFVANGGKFVTTSGNFVAGDDKVEIKSGSATMFKADNSGNIESRGTFAIKDSEDNTKFSVDNSGNLNTSGSATVNSLAIGATGKGINSTGAATLASLTFDGTNSVNAVDTGAAAITSGDGTTIATTATVLTSAENATYTAGTSATNTANGTLNGAIASLDSAIGNRGTLSTTNNHLTTTGTIVANLNALDSAIGNVSFSGTNTNSAGDLTVAINNIDNAIGNRGTLSTTNNHLSTTGTIVTNLNALDSAIGNNQYANNIGVNYAAVTNGTNLTAAINQMASNIGSAPNATNGNILATNTVNQNLDRIDTKIGKLSDLFAGTGSTGNAITKGTGIAPTTVVAALNNIDETLGQIHGLKNGNSHLKSNSNLADGTTVEQHLVSLDDAIGNRNISSANTDINNATASNIASAMETTGNLIGSMDFDETKYIAGATNMTDALATLDKNVERVENRLEKVEHNLKSGLAAVSALSALVPNARDCGDTQLSVGTGMYADRVGVAFGGFHYFNDHVLFNAGASYGGTRDWAFRAGLTFGI